MKKRSAKLIIHDIAINLVKPAEYNPRRLSKKQYNDIKRSIDEFDFIDPIIVNKHPDRHNIIVGGHQRVKVAKDMGFSFLPAVFVELTLEREKELNIRMNKNSGSWDYDILANEFEAEELIDYGFGLDELGFLDENEPEKTLDDLTDDEIIDNDRSVTLQFETILDRNKAADHLNEMGYNVIKPKLK